ncbi:MAG: sulfatase-like hydrolase/transferase [Bacteroidetes bacterium]|nr:sulfatase-like hydrolase/transferase [Bacteroidota bacterium]
MKKPHLFWILIDSARNYETDQDMRGLPKAVVDFGKQGLYFKNVITSAPSTLQSISSMMTSSPSYLMSRSYNNFRGKFSCFDYFPDMLRDNGYNVIGAIYFKHGREVMSDMFGLVDKKFYPKHLSHSKEVWTNQDIYDLFSEVMAKHDWSKPTMTYLHFNVRVDDNVSDIVNQVIADIKAKGLYDESVILMNSDHGYPDADKGYDFEAGLKEGWGHDKYMTNDNILTPLVIRHPGTEHKVIEQSVATIDIVPTLCSLLGIKVSAKFHGYDLTKEHFDLNDRLIRTDNRYVGQSPSFHSYTQGDKKLIVYREEGKEDVNSFYNLSTDPLEKNPVSSSEGFTAFYKEVTAHEMRLNQFHQNLLERQWKSRLKKEIASSPNSIVLVLPSTNAFQRIANQAIRSLFPKASISLHQDEKALSSQFDLKLYILESEVPWDLKRTKRHGASITAKKEVYLDNNGERIQKPVSLNLYHNFLSKRWAIIKHDPGSLKDILQRIFRKRLLSPIR